MSLPQHLQQQAANNVLRRSHKTDFNPGNMPSSSGLCRDRSFVKQSNLHKRRNQTMATMKSSSKPTMEIYRPPNVRTDHLPNNMLQHLNQGNAKLNVHAKEFTMTSHELQTSKSSGNLSHFLTSNHLQGDIIQKTALRHPQHHVPLLIPSTPIQSSLMHSASSILVPNAQRVNFQMPELATSSTRSTYGLKRSKSMVETNQNRNKLGHSEGIDLGSFPEEERAHLKSALEDPNSLASRSLMDLVKIILDRVVEGIKYSEAGAKLCIRIIEKERTQTFIETLINTCQQWYQERNRILRGIKAGDGTRFTAFMWFLTEMCGQLKRHQVRSECELLQPDVVLLSVLSKCCMACVSLPIRCLAETECLFFVLTSIGRDLENELPAQLELLMASVRDGFLASAGASSVRRTLLQLIELHASKWQLPGSSVLYYYPRVK